MAHADSVFVSSDFLRSSHAETAEKLIYVVLASITDRKNTAIASLRELSRLSGLSINTVRKAIQLLQVHGYIDVYSYQDRGMPHIYLLHHMAKGKGKQAIKIPLHIIYNRLICPTVKVVYAVLLAYQAYNQHKCCPSLRTISHCIGKSIRTVQRAIATLRECHAISSTLVCAQNGKYPHNEYTLHSAWLATQHNNCQQPRTVTAYNTILHSSLTTKIAKNQENEQKKTCVGISGSSTGKSIKNIYNNTSEMYYTSDVQQSQATITIDSLKEQISYDWLIEQHNGVRADIDNCLQAIIDGLRICANNKPIIISGHQYDYAAYITAVRQLTADHIQLAIERWRLRARSTAIGNPLAYLRSIVINTLYDIDLHYASQVEFDTYN